MNIIFVVFNNCYCQLNEFALFMALIYQPKTSFIIDQRCCLGLAPLPETQ